MDFYYVIVGFRHHAIDSVIDSVGQGRGRVIDSVIDSVLAHVQNALARAQQIIDSVGNTPTFFYRINGKDRVLELAEMKKLNPCNFVFRRFYAQKQ